MFGNHSFLCTFVRSPFPPWRGSEFHVQRTTSIAQPSPRAIIHHDDMMSALHRRFEASYSPLHFTNMSSTSRETIHVSLGPSANAITAHLLNLQGLAATDAESTCNPNITHAVANETYVPRVLIVDQASQFSASQQSPQVDETVATWNGPASCGGTRGDKSTTQAGALQEAASALAYSSYSRYHVSPTSHNIHPLAMDDMSIGTTWVKKKRRRKMRKNWRGDKNVPSKSGSSIHYNHWKSNWIPFGKTRPMILCHGWSIGCHHVHHTTTTLCRLHFPTTRTCSNIGIPIKWAPLQRRQTTCSKSFEDY